MTDEKDKSEARPKNELVRAAIAGDAEALAHLERHGDDITKLMAQVQGV